jgi:DNA-binding NarL/FixJ family response regulator
MKNSAITIVSRSQSIARFIGCKLRERGYRGIITFVNESHHVEEEIVKIRPAYLFMESCFYHCVTANMLARLIRKYKNLPICVFAVEDCPPRTAARFIYWGVESYLNFRDDAASYTKGLDVIMEGKPYMPDYVAEIAASYDEVPAASLELTPREQEIVRLIAAGKSSDEIARTLDLKTKTVENHKASMYGKCNVRNSIELLRFAMRRSILSPEDLCS